MKKIFSVVFLCLFLQSINLKAQSNTSNVQLKKNVELRHISQIQLSSMNLDTSNLEKYAKESHHYFVDENQNTFFLLKNENELFYYLNRIYNDNDIINKVSKQVYYIVHADADLITKKSEMLEVDVINKKISR
ncbi:MAG: hypothetical protein V4565_00275 [Bacteroidota bacterium]